MRPNLIRQHVLLEFLLKAMKDFREKICNIFKVNYSYIWNHPVT